MFNPFKKDEPEIEVPEPSTAFKAAVVINGSMKGGVQGACNVLVEEKGHCVGSFSVKDLVIHGTVIGDVYAEELVIHPTGKLYFRNVFAQNTIVHEGGVYSGHIDTLDGEAVMKPEPESRSTDLFKMKPETKQGPTTLPQEKDEKRKKGPTFISTY